MRWWERVGAWHDNHHFAADAIGAVILGLLLVPFSFGLVYPGGPRALLTLAALGMVAALPWRRTRPALSAAVVFSMALLHFLGGEYLIIPVDLLVLVALYSVTVHGPVWAYRTAITGALTGSALFGAVIVASAQWVGVGSGVFFAVALGLMSLSTFAFGLVRRARRESIESLVDRAARLEVERDQQARIATAAERARIAREMHDIVAHSLSVIIAQADGGRYAAGQDPAAATRSLSTISETGRAALTDMRRLLGVLRPEVGRGAEGAVGGAGTVGGAGRGPDGAPAARGAVEGASAGGRSDSAGRTPSDPAGPAALAPQPAVGDIDQLVEQVRGSGVRISVVRMGSPRRLPPGTDLTVYRICQESLTNILKHAGPSPTATVLLQWAANALVLQVTDDGRGAAAESDGVGQGVLGMRERAAMLGGTLTVGPRPGGGYRVRAEIPIPPFEERQ